VSDPAPEEYQQAFIRIEAEVDKGNTDLASLGFWRLVRQVKLEPRLAEHWADVVGRIDRKAFERRIRPRFPVWLGNLVFLVQTAVLIAFIPVAIALGRDAAPAEEPLLAALMIVAAAGGLSISLHDLTHFAFGRLAGIRFAAYYFHRPQRTPGLKIDYASYLRASPGARAWMHASGAIVSKIAPFAVFTAVYLPHRSAGYDLFPSWSLWVILAFGVVQVITDIVLSTKGSDWKRFRRERRIGRQMESVPRR
jgi:hypothetical protein